MSLTRFYQILPRHDFDRSLLNLNLLGIEFSTWRFVERWCSKSQFWMKVLILWPSTRGEPMGTHFYDSCRSSTSLTPFDSSIVVLTMHFGWRDVSTHMTHHDISNLFMSLSNIKHTETLWNIGNLSHVYIGTLPWRSFICQKFWKWSTARLCWWKLKWLEWVVLAAPKKDVVERSKISLNWGHLWKQVSFSDAAQVAQLPIGVLQLDPSFWARSSIVNVQSCTKSEAMIAQHPTT